MNRSLSTDSIIESILMKPRSSSFFMPKQYTSTGFLFQKKDSRDLFISPTSTRKSKNRHQTCELISIFIFSYFLKVVSLEFDLKV